VPGRLVLAIDSSDTGRDPQPATLLTAQGCVIEYPSFVRDAPNALLPRPSSKRHVLSVKDQMLSSQPVQCGGISSGDDGSTQPVHSGEVLVLVAAAVAIVGCCVADSYRRLFWCDEAFTAFAVGDPSLNHMLAGLRDEINAMPPLFFVLGWCWAQLFGVSALSLRLPSAIFLIMGIVVLWLTLRQLTHRWAAVACAVALPLLSNQFIYNVCEARCYGIYFAAYSVAVALYLRCRDPLMRGRLFFVAVTLTHGILVATHYVGGIFSLVLVLAALMSWQLDHQPRFRRYALHAAVGWLAVIPSLPFLLAQAKLSAPGTNWIPRPGLRDLVMELGGGQMLGMPVILTLLLLAGMIAACRPESIATVIRRGRAGWQARHVALLMAATLAMLAAAWLESRWGAIIFHPRYLFPTLVAWVLVIGCTSGWLIDRLWGDAAGDAHLPGMHAAPAGALCWLTLLGRAVVGAVLVVLAGGAISQLAKGRATTDEPMSVAASDRLAQQLATAREFPDVPVVTRTIIDFAPLAYYLSTRGRVLMLTDKGIVGPWTTIHHGMAMQRHYRPESMATLDEILARKGQFLTMESYDSEVIVTAMKQRPEWQRTELQKFTSLWRFVGSD